MQGNWVLYKKVEWEKKLNKKLLIIKYICKYRLNIYNLKFKYIGRSGQDRWVVIVMTQTQPNSQLKKIS